MSSLEFALGNGAFNESSLLVTKLPKLVISPNKECAIIESSNTVPSATTNVINIQRSIFVHIHKP